MMQKNKKTEINEIFMLLQVINANPQMTQRDLSSRLGLSLGKINFLIRTMVEKGLIKTENFMNSKHKIAYLYLLTPKGVEEKAKITYHFLKRKMMEYEKLEEEIQQLRKEVDLLDITMADPE